MSMLMLYACRERVNLTEDEKFASQRRGAFREKDGDFNE